MKVLKHTSLSNIIFILFLISIFFFFLFPLSGDGDFFHDASIGKSILQSHTLPSVDHYTFTENGHSWIANAWGTGIIYYVLYSHFGSAAISIYIALQAVLLFSLLYLLLDRYTGNKPVVYLSLFVSIGVIASRWPDRPELITYIFVSLLLLLDAYTSSKKYLPLLFPCIILLWTILYTGSVFVGLGLLIYFCLKQFIIDKYIINKKSYLLYIASIIAIPFSLASGYGFNSLFYILLIPHIALIQGEWAGILTILQQASPVQLLLLQYKIIPFILFFVVMICLLIWNYRIIARHPFLALYCVSLLMPFYAIRNIPLATILCLPLLSFLLLHLYNTKKTIILSFIICISCLCTFISFSVNEHGTYQDNNTFPVDVIQFFQTNHLTGKVFTNQQLGSFITYSLYPKVLVYADTRDDLFIGTPILTDFYNTLHTNRSIIPLLNTYGADIFVGYIPDGQAYESIFYSPQWILVYMNNNYFIFVKYDFAQKNHMGSLYALDPYSSTGSKPKLEYQAIDEYQSILRRRDSFSVRFYLAETLLSIKNYSSVITTAKKLAIPVGLTQPIYSNKKDFLLSTAYLLEKDCTPAKEYIDAYNSDITLKLLLKPYNKLVPSTVDEEYMLYYLLCQHDQYNAQNSLNNFLDDPLISDAEKEQAQNMFNQLTTSPTQIPGLQ